MPATASTPLLPRPLGDGLLLRATTAADIEPLCELNAIVHGDHDTGAPSEAVGIIARDLLNGQHPTTRADDFTLVEDTATGQIVSTLVLISQTWRYADIPIGVGRVELVGTLPAYRRRGLVRAQMDVLHARSAARGHLMQVISGIPHYYRQFGYEMAMHLGGHRACFRPHVPKLAAGQAEPFCLRPATLVDVPFLAETWRHGSRRHLIACPYDAAQLRYELTARDPRSECRLSLAVIVSPDGDRAGFVAMRPVLEQGRLNVMVYELVEAVSWLAVTPSVLRGLAALADTLAAPEPATPDPGATPDSGATPWHALSFQLGTEHPLYTAARRCLAPPAGPPYAWYVRVADLPAFLWRIAPALEARLAASLAAGHTGELRLSFYRSGLRLAFQRGKLTAAEPWEPIGQPGASASFPDLTFLKLLTGYQMLDEIRAGYPDAGARSGEAEVLLGVLFPKGLPPVWAIE